MNRRELLASGIGAAGTLASVGVILESGKVMANSAKAAKKATPKSNFNQLIESSSKCISTGLICIKHCQKELAEGNKAMAECLQSVMELSASCESLLHLAALDSAFTKEFAQLSAKICANCAKICEKHSQHMDSCKNCMEACLECEKACKAA
jgi:Cys-rich four helix bundle protein (predicted Tat secretion target)